MWNLVYPRCHPQNEGKYWTYFPGYVFHKEKKKEKHVEYNLCVDNLERESNV
jgi:hypothetical protein